MGTRAATGARAAAVATEDMEAGERRRRQSDGARRTLVAAIGTSAAVVERRAHGTRPRRGGEGAYDIRATARKWSDREQPCARATACHAVLSGAALLQRTLSGLRAKLGCSSP